MAVGLCTAVIVAPDGVSLASTSIGLFAELAVTVALSLTASTLGETVTWKVFVSKLPSLSVTLTATVYVAAVA